MLELRPGSRACTPFKCTNSAQTMNDEGEITLQRKQNGNEETRSKFRCGTIASRPQTTISFPLQSLSTLPSLSLFVSQLVHSQATRATYFCCYQGSTVRHKARWSRVPDCDCARMEISVKNRSSVLWPGCLCVCQGRWRMPHYTWDLTSSFIWKKRTSFFVFCFFSLMFCAVHVIERASNTARSCYPNSRYLI